MAAAWYQAHGYQLLARNWSCRGGEVEGEIDIVACRGNLSVFCEVKARSSPRFGLPAEAVGPAKQARLRRLAAAWFAQRSPSPAEPAAQSPGRGRRAGGPVRFDVATILAGGVDVFEGAF